MHACVLYQSTALSLSIATPRSTVFAPSLPFLLVSLSLDNGTMSVSAALMLLDLETESNKTLGDCQS